MGIKKILFCLAILIYIDVSKYLAKRKELKECKDMRKIYTDMTRINSIVAAREKPGVRAQKRRAHTTMIYMKKYF